MNSNIINATLINEMTHLPYELADLIIQYTAPNLFEKIEMVATQAAEETMKKCERLEKEAAESHSDHANKILASILQVASKEEFITDPEKYLLLLTKNSVMNPLDFVEMMNTPLEFDTFEVARLTRFFIAIFLVLSNKNPMECMHRLKPVLESLFLYKETLSAEKNLEHIQSVARDDMELELTVFTST